MDDPLTHSEIMIVLMSTYLLILWGIHRYQSRDVYARIHEFPMDAAIDAIVRAHIQGLISDEIFEKLILWNDKFLHDDHHLSG